MSCSKSSFWECIIPGVICFCISFKLPVYLTYWPEPLASTVQCLKHYFSPFCLDLSWAKQGYEQLCRWATQGEWRDKAYFQGLATCSPANMPFHQISIIPARETACNGRSSMGRNKEKNKEVEVRGGLIQSSFSSQYNSLCHWMGLKFKVSWVPTLC